MFRGEEMSGDSPDSIELPFMTALLLAKSLGPPLDPLGICVTSPAKPPVAPLPSPFRYFYCMRPRKSYLSKIRLPGYCKLIICGRREIIRGLPGYNLIICGYSGIHSRRKKVGPLLGPLLDLPVGKSGLCCTNDTGDIGRIP